MAKSARHRVKTFLNYFLVIALVMTALTGCNRPDSGKTVKMEKHDTGSEEASTAAKSRITSIKTSKPANKNTARASAPVATDDTGLTQPMVQISGKVTFEDNSLVTTGTVTVISYERKGNTFTTTESDPSYINGEGQYVIRVPHSSYMSLRFNGEFPPTMEQVEVGNSSFKPGLKKIKKDVTVEHGVEIKGRVVDDKNRPVNDALVTLRYTEPGRSASSETSTSSTLTGEFVLPYVRHGKSKAMAFHKDYVTGLADVMAPTTEPLTITMLSEGATVSGHVYRRETGAPQPGVKVSIVDKITYKPKDTISAADGSYTISKIRPGFNALSATSEEPRLGTFPDNAKNINAQLQLADKETTYVDITMYEGHTLSGRTYDKETGESVGGVAIQNLDGNTLTTSSEDGTYKVSAMFPGTNPGTIQIQAAKEGYIVAGANRFQERMIETSTNNNDLNPILDIPLVGTLTVSGKVTTSDGVPVPNTAVTLKDENGSSEKRSVLTNGDGTYKIEIRPFTDAAVIAKAEGYASGYSKAFRVDNTDLDNVDITLDVGATVQGTVIGPDEKPISKANVTASAWVRVSNMTFSDSQDSIETDESGRFTLNNLSKTVQLTASHGDYAHASGERLELNPGEIRTDIRLQLKEGFSISGIVVDANDKPVQGTHVYSSGGGGSQQTGSDGTFEINNLPEGTYQVYASGSQGSVQKDNVKTGTKDLKLQFAPQKKWEKTKLIGTVVDATTKEPIEKFEINNLGNIELDPDRKGGFTASDLAQAVTYSANVTVPGYPKTTLEVKVPTGQAVFEQELPIGKGGAITGTIVESGSKKPIPNVLVINWGKTRDDYARRGQLPESSVTTDETGKFTLAPAPEGTNYFIVRPKSPLAEVNKSIEVKNDEVTDAGAIEVGTGGVIYGTVTQGKGKEPVSNLSLQIYGQIQNSNEQIRKTATTDTEGKYRVEALPAASYNIMTDKYSLRESANIALGEEKEVNIHIGGTTVVGKVTRGGEPVRCSISASQISGAKLQASTSTSGQPYKLTGLTAGEWKFYVYAYEENNSGRSYEESVTVPDTEEFEKNFELPDVRIEGIVVDSEGEPVPDAQVQLSQKQTSAGNGDGWRGGYNASIRTKNDGRFSFNGVAEGTYQVFARKEPLGSAMEAAVTAKDGRPADLKLQLSTNGGTLISVALNMADGNGIQSAWCYLYGENGRFTHTSTRNESGIMQISNVPPGKYTTNVSSWGFSQSEKSVEIKAGETVTIEDVLYAAGAIEWTLANANGGPAKASGTANPLDQGSIEKPKSASTAADGKLVVRGLAPGNYQVTATAPGKSSVTETFTVIAGDVAKKQTTVPGW